MANQAKVAEAYIELQLNLAKYKAAVGDATADIKKLSASMRQEMNASRQGIRLVTEELGVHMPRALQGFVAKLPGVATAMNAAFNAVAVLALVNILVQAGEKVAEFVQKTQDAASKNKQAWAGITTPLQLSNDEMRVVNDNLSNAIAKLEHKPQNGIKLAIDEAVLSADKLSSKLTEDLNKIQETLKSTAPGFTAQAFGEAGTGDLQTKYAALQARIDAANQAGQDAIKAAQNGSGTDAQREAAVTSAKKALQDSLTPIFKEGAKTFGDALRAALASDKSQRDNAVRVGLDPNKLDTGMTSRIQASSSLLSSFNGQLEAQQLGVTNDALTAKDKVLTAQKEDIENAKRASAELLQTYQTAFEKQKAEYGMSLLAESAFWREKLANFRANSKEYGEVYAKANEPINKLIAGTAQAFRDRTGAAPSMTSDKSMDADNSAIAKGIEQQAAFNEEWTLTSIRFREATGAISANDAATLTAATHAEGYRSRIEALSTELAKLKAEELDVNGVNVDPNNAAKQQNIQNQIADLQNKSKLQSFTDAQSTLSTTWVGMIDSVFDELIKKSKDTTGELKQITSSLIDGINGNLAKMLTGQKTNFRGTLRSSGEQLTKSGISKLEGVGLSALGLGGGKRDGSSAGSALYVQMAGAGGGLSGIPGLNLFNGPHPTVTGPNGQIAGSVATQASRGLLGMLNNSNWASSLFGGKLFGSGSLFGGGFALGGDVQAGVPINVGEMGIERFTPSVPGHITPNKELGGGGGNTYNIGAGADPVQVHDAIVKANRHTYNHATHDATRAMAERQRRTPR